MTRAAGSGPELASLIADRKPAQHISDYLDALSEPERITATRSLGGADQAKLWQLMDGFAPLSLEDLVPAGTPELAPVRHYGKNSMPMFTHFEKRFYRSPNGGPLAGANFQTVSPVTGPGYFVVQLDPQRHELLVDYRALPASKPSDWPRIVDNRAGISRFVYGFMVDTLRRVSRHVTIGRAARHGKPMSAWFVLCREQS
jgi:hypothetical protein